MMWTQYKSQGLRSLGARIWFLHKFCPSAIYSTSSSQGKGNCWPSKDWGMWTAIGIGASSGSAFSAASLFPGKHRILCRCSPARHSGDEPNGIFILLANDPILANRNIWGFGGSWEIFCSSSMPNLHVRTGKATAMLQLWGAISSTEAKNNSVKR